MNKTILEQAAEITRLSERATVGPWLTDVEMSREEPEEAGVPILWIAKHPETNMDAELFRGDYGTEQDAQLISAMRSFAPEVALLLPKLVEALLFYMTVCGNTCHQVSRETAMEMHAMGSAAIAPLLKEQP